MDVTLLAGGPARAYIDIASVLTEVGHLHGGIDVNNTEPAIMDLMTDELGETPADGVFNGRSQPDTVVVRLAEYSLANLKRGIPNSVLITDATTPSKQRVEVRATAGGKLSAVASKWVFKPIDMTTGAVSTNANDWVTVHKGAAVGAVSTTYKKGEQRIIEITLRCLPDTANNNRTVSYGDLTAAAA